MSKENIRFYIKMHVALNVPARDIYEELYTVHGDQAPCLRTVERWCQRFREGQEELDDDTRSGRPVAATTPENIEQVRLIINEDSRVTIEEIQEQVAFDNDILICTYIVLLSLSMSLRVTAREPRRRLFNHNFFFG